MNTPSLQFVDRRNARLAIAWQNPLSIGLLDVSCGALTDGSSIPELLWNVPGFAPWEGDTIEPSFSHDMLYAGELCPRAQADQVLYARLRANGVSWLRAQTYYRFVRWFGGAVWAKHTPESIARARTFARLL